MRHSKFLLFLFTVVVLYSCKESHPDSPPMPPVVDSTPPRETIRTDIPEVAPNPMNRVAWQKPDLILEKIGQDLAGKVVADIGAGPTGFFSLKLAREGARVIAIDIDPAALSYIEKEKAKLDSAQQSLIQTRLARVDNPRLQKEEIDAILIVNTVAYLGNKQTYLANLKNNLKPGGRIVIVDFKMKRLPEQIAPPKSERIYVDVVEEYLYRAGYKNIQVDDQSLAYQYIITAEK